MGLTIPSLAMRVRRTGLTSGKLASMTLQTPSRGLTAAEVAERVRRGDVNTLPPRGGRSSWDIVRANVFTRINAILVVLFVVVISTGSWQNALFGFLVIINSGIGIVQELRAKATLESLTLLGESKPTIRRDGVSAPMFRDVIVVDDLIEVGPGDQIVVDGDIEEAAYLEVDESLLTGESDQVAKGQGDAVMSGSFVVSGTGAYRATKVGAAAYAAQLAAEASRFTLVKSELQQGINKILRLITWLMVPVGALTIWVQLSQGSDNWQQAVLRTAGALVPMVPEGLVLLTSLAFAVGIIRLGQRQCLVQEMPALEGLARVDVVCADKTGTLTENGMTVSEIVPLGGASPHDLRPLLAQVTAADPRPNASIRAVAAAVGSPGEPWPVVALAPFTSAKKWSGVSFANGRHLVVGAPDVLAPPGSSVAAQAEEIGLTGRRVLLVGTTGVQVDADNAAADVTPIALLVLDQKVRPEARATLEFFADQDVALKVISGDNAAAVGAVTRGLGLRGADAVDARTLPNDEAAFADVIADGQVFGRVTPHQKRQMVAALQSRGHTVAMTGDGVNDVLALKDADLGVAMGSGSPATRSVAQIVLLDDSFATLPFVVKEGRQVIGNIERVANMFLTKTVYSILIAALVVVGRLPFPFQPIHITLLGWFTIGIPASIMALAPNTDRVRPGFIDRVMRFGLPAGVAVAVTAFVAYLAVAPAPGVQGPAMGQASTAALAALILAGAWVMIVIARPYQWWKVLLLVACLAGAVLSYVLPIGQWFFKLDPSNADMMRTGLLVGAVGAAAVEVVWWVSGRVGRDPRRVWAPRGSSQVG
jgi:cation-transporting P-type ATPase E